MIIPALVSAAEDRNLRGAPLGVYVWLVCHQLDFVEYHALKIAGLAQTLQIKDETASRALRLLVEGGYIERRFLGRDGHGYRLRMRKAS